MYISTDHYTKKNSYRFKSIRLKYIMLPFEQNTLYSVYIGLIYITYFLLKYLYLTPLIVVLLTC